MTDELAAAEGPAKLKPPTQPVEQPLTLAAMDGWARRAGAYIDGLTETAHAGTGLPFDVVRATITKGKDDFMAPRKLLQERL
jgi:hypothetical protein